MWLQVIFLHYRAKGSKTYLKGILVDDLEKGVRFVIKRSRPVEKPPIAESDPT